MGEVIFKRRSDGTEQYAILREGLLKAKRSALIRTSKYFLWKEDPYMSIELHKNIEIHTEYPCLVTKFATSYRFAKVTSPGQDPWYASPRCKDCIKSTQYCLDIVAGVVSKCGACHADESRADAPRFERCAPGDWTLMDADIFADKQVSECGYALIQRLRQVTFREDIAIWKNPIGDILIELMACAAKFYIRDGELTFGDSGEFTVTHSGSHWTDFMDNVLLLKKNNRYYVLVLEHIVQPLRIRSFKHQVFHKHKKDEEDTNTPFIVDPVHMNDEYHLIPIHTSGLTVLPPSYDAIWAYINSCLMYVCTSLAGECLLLLASLEDVVSDRRLLPNIQTMNWPMANESFKRKFHTTRPPRSPNELTRTLQTWGMETLDANIFSLRSRDYSQIYREVSDGRGGVIRVEMGKDALAMEKKRADSQGNHVSREVDGTRDKALVNYDHSNSKDLSVTQSTIDYIGAHFTGIDPPLEVQQYARSSPGIIYMAGVRK